MRETIDPKHVNSVIFDFDGTLCSERYFELLGHDSLDSIRQLVFGDNADRWADPWMRGELTSHDIAFYLSEHLPESQDDILFALRQGCSNMTFNSGVYDFALRHRQSSRKTALVTANMDVFTEVVVPAHGLDSVFDLVLNTADFRTLDKTILWRRAFEALGPEHSFSSALLIEDSPRMIALFRLSGGFAYRYEGDEALQAWLEETGFMEETQNQADGATP
jgi:phosphoserine phosphatase